MTRMYEHHDAVLHSVREGVLVISGEGRLLLANDEACRLLDLPEDVRGRMGHRPRPGPAYCHTAGFGPSGHRRGDPGG